MITVAVSGFAVLSLRMVAKNMTIDGKINNEKFVEKMQTQKIALAEQEMKMKKESS